MKKPVIVKTNDDLCLSVGYARVEISGIRQADEIALSIDDVENERYTHTLLTKEQAKELVKQLKKLIYTR